MLLHQEHVRTLHSREMSIFFMWNKIIDEDREEVLFSFKLVVLLASLLLPAPRSGLCSSCVQMCSHPTHPACPAAAEGTITLTATQLQGPAQEQPWLAGPALTGTLKEPQQPPWKNPQGLWQILTSFCWICGRWCSPSLASGQVQAQPWQ